MTIHRRHIQAAATAALAAVYTTGGRLDGHVFVSLKPETLSTMVAPQSLPRPTADGSVRQELIWQVRTLDGWRLAAPAAA